MGQEVAVPDRRHVRLFRNGRNQAVRIPVEFELPGDEAIRFARAASSSGTERPEIA